MIITEKNVLKLDFDKIKVDDFWSTSTEKELLMHKIHAYPAKFPSLVIKKSIAYAKKRKVSIDTIADFFCGCGTTALESKIQRYDFWGCDINPVAVLMAKVKSKKYDEEKILNYFDKIVFQYKNIKKHKLPKYYSDNERLKYWFDKKSIKNLHKLLYSIKKIPEKKYKDFFLCAFSNILKGSSKWLTKSIKPQIDPNKKRANILSLFEKQIHLMQKANKEIISFDFDHKSKIECKNILRMHAKKPIANLVITSPPYVTSYEYADLHQLSTIWLKYSSDYRNLRKGTIGSSYLSKNWKKNNSLINEIGISTFEFLYIIDKAKARAVARYFIDLTKTVEKTYLILKNNSLAIFVIGNTKYKNIEINNAKYLSFAMLKQGFDKVDVFKRKIGSKILTPFRDEKGKFSKNDSHRRVYNYEFIVIGYKHK